MMVICLVVYIHLLILNFTRYSNIKLGRIIVSGYFIRFISEYATLRISKSSLLEMYAKAVCPTKAEGKVSGIVRASKEYPYALKVIPAGYMNRRVNESLNIYGYGFSNE